MIRYSSLGSKHLPFIPNEIKQIKCISLTSCGDVLNMIHRNQVLKDALQKLWDCCHSLTKFYKYYISANKPMSAIVSSQESDFWPSTQSQRTSQPTSPTPKSRRRLQMSGRLGWSQCQNLIYYNFLEKNLELFSCNQKRREYMVFSLLGKDIRSRSISQIKSHHQKMIKKHKSIQSIMAFLRTQLFSSTLPNPTDTYPPEAQPKSQEARKMQSPGEVKSIGQQQLQLGVSNKFLCEDAFQNEQWFSDV